MLRALDLITIVVPPALPATMAVGISFSISRLRKAGIYCISPPRVNICGKIEVFFFLNKFFSSANVTCFPYKVDVL